MPAVATAASLQVSPITVEVPAPGSATTIKLRNEGTAPLNAQIRVYRWLQKDGVDALEPSNDVVASPPIATLAPETDYTVRLVRVAKEPATTGETYRLLVDEIPDRAASAGRAVSFVMRYSVPVFFYPRNLAPARLTWSLEQHKGAMYLTAKNNGGRHARISGLTLRDSHGDTTSLGKGLTGYILGHSTRRWQVRNNVRQLSRGGAIALAAQSDSGPVHVTLAVHRTQ
jgi:fimbrial chaperone protein